MAEAGGSRAVRVKVTRDAVIVDLVDGRTVMAPLAWYPRLLHATPRERNRWRMIGGGEGIHWPDLDEDVSVDGLLAGKPSGESPLCRLRGVRLGVRSVNTMSVAAGGVCAATQGETTEEKFSPSIRHSRSSDRIA